MRIPSDIYVVKLLWAIIPLLLVGIVGVQDVDGLWIPRSTEDLVKQSHTIVIGNVTSIDVIQSTETTIIVGPFDSKDDLPLEPPFSAKIINENDNSKEFEITYVSNIEEITVNVEEYIKNLPMFENTIIKARAPNFAVGVPGLHHQITSHFELGDRVLLYFTGSIINQTYARESFVFNILDGANENPPDKEYEKNPVNEKSFKAPLRQIRDDGVGPQNVKCNEGKVLFFRWTNSFPKTSPVCIFEKSIEKFDNTFMTWTGKGNSYFVDLVDRNYLNELNSNLKRETVVHYKVDFDTSNIIFNVTEHIQKQEKEFVIHNMVIDSKPTLSYFHDPKEPRPLLDFRPSPMILPSGPEATPFVDTRPPPNHKLFYHFNEIYFDIRDKNGNNPVDWHDPRTSIQLSGYGNQSYLYGPTDKCGDEHVAWLLPMSLESTFKIKDNIESVTIEYPDRIMANFSNSNNTQFSDMIWSQDQTEFVFGEGFEKFNIVEIPCISEFGNASHLYEIMMEIQN